MKIAKRLSMFLVFGLLLCMKGQVFGLIKPSAGFYALLEGHTRMLCSCEEPLDGICFPFSLTNERLKRLTYEISSSKRAVCLQDFWLKEGAGFLQNEGLDFVREYALVLFAVYQKVLWRLSHEPETRIALIGIFSLYMKLKRIPLEELFSALDRCLIMYKEILEDHSFPFHNIWNLRSWLREYWFLPIVFFASGLWAYRQWRMRQSRGGLYSSETACVQSRTSIFVEHHIDYED